MAKTYGVNADDLRKVVTKTAIRDGLAKPAEKPRSTRKQEEKEDGHLKSQRILLTWMLEGEEIFRQIRKYVSPEDFTEELYRQVAELYTGSMTKES